MSGPGRHEAPEKARPRWRRFLVRVGISGAILAGLFTYLPREALWASLGRISVFQWGIGLVGFMGGHLLGIFKWQVILRVTGVQLRWADAARCYCAGLFANLCLPSLVGGDVLRAGLAMRITGRKEAVVVGSLLDRFIDILALGVLVTGAGLVAPRALGAHVGAVLAVVASGVGAVILVTLLLVRSRPPTRWSGRARRQIARARLALRAVTRRMTITSAGLGLAVGVQGLFVLLNAFLGLSIGLSAPLRVWFLTWPLAKLAALAPVSLGGLGVREIAFAGLLQPFGIPFPLAVAQSLLWETILVAGGLSAGLIWWGMGSVAQLRSAAASAHLLASKVSRGS